MPKRLLTIAEYAQLPDDDNYRDELSQGRIVREPRPGERHGAIIVELVFRLRTYLEQHPGVGELRTDSGFVLSRNPLTIRGPDVAFVRASRLAARPAIGFFEGAPDLAIEVVSPSNTAAELQNKVLEYLAAGTQVVWVVYPDSNSVLEHDADGSARILGAADFLTAPLLPEFRLQIQDILRGTR